MNDARRIDRRAADDVALVGDRPRAAAARRRRPGRATSCRHRTRRGRPRRTGRPRTPRARDRACGRSARHRARWSGVGRRAPHRDRGPDPTGTRALRAVRRGAAGWRSRAAATRSGGDPAQAFGTHGRTPAPSVVDAMNPTAPRATTPGPIQRSHRDSTMTVDLLRRTRRLAGGGRGHDARRRPLSRAYRDGGPRGSGVRRTAMPRQAGAAAKRAGRPCRRVLPLRRVVAKSVRSRHSPATVSAPPRARVRSPTTRCMLEPSRER